ncbi:MAG: hypothetical protein Fur0032_08670 [Terrimicrobiaceae bacterium]
MISLTLAEWIRLDEPTWAVTTAFVLSTPKFVGAIAEKTVFRIVGALAGACLGYLITGSLEQTPLFFLGAMGLLLTFTTAMYGGTFAPYLLRQAGYTATLVASQGMHNPQFCWQVGLARCEEICLGIAVTACVTILIWPRYARAEFVQNARSTIWLLAGQFLTRAEAFAAGGPEPSGDVLARTGTSLAKLRRLIRLASMESRNFRDRIDEVDHVVAGIGTLSTAVAGLSGSLRKESLYREYIGVELEDLHASIENLFRLASEPSTRKDIEQGIERGRVCLAAYEKGMERLRAAGVGMSIPLDESLGHGGYHLAIREILSALEDLARGLPLIGENLSEGLPRVRFVRPTLPSLEWWKAGLRGALAVVTALVIVNWVNPPGGDMLIVGTYLFSAFSIDSPDHRGDLGVFQLTILFQMATIGLFLILLVVAAPMSSYVVFAILFCSLLFLTGFWMEHAVFSTFTTIWFLLLAANLVDLNPQQPVPFQSIVDFVLGISMATVLSALVRRLIWPLLPQRVLIERILETLHHLRAALSFPSKKVGMKLRAAIVLGLADARQLAGTLKDHALSPDDARAVKHYFVELEKLATLVMALPGCRLNELGELERDFQNRWGEASTSLIKSVDLQRDHIAGRTEEFRTGGANLSEEWLTGFRARARALHLPMPELLATLGWVDRLRRCQPTAQAAISAALDIQPKRIATDWRL